MKNKTKAWTPMKKEKHRKAQKSMDSHDALQRIETSPTRFKLDRCKCAMKLGGIQKN